jgi:hypothetical protein
MAWEVEYTSRFESWWNSLSENERVEISAKVELLEQFGPTLPRPHADVISSSRHSNMKELRARLMSAICGCSMPSIPNAQRCSQDGR